MLRRSTAAMARAAAPATRAFSAAANASGEVKFDFASPFELHRTWRQSDLPIDRSTGSDQSDGPLLMCRSRGGPR
jgi:hypothetical protein